MDKVEKPINKAKKSGIALRVTHAFKHYKIGEEITGEQDIKDILSSPHASHVTKFQPK